MSIISDPYLPGDVHRPEEVHPTILRRSTFPEITGHSKPTPYPARLEAYRCPLFAGRTNKRRKNGNR